MTADAAPRPRPRRTHAGAPLIALFALLLPAFAATAGNVDTPEIIDDAGDTGTRFGTFIPELDIFKGWVTYKDDAIVTALQVASAAEAMKERTQIVFHFTYKANRAFAAVNLTPDGSALDWHYGTYTGAGNMGAERLYLYVPMGNAKGFFSEGTPATYTWRIPTGKLGEAADGDTIASMFITTYQAGDRGQRVTVDYAESPPDGDYVIDERSLADIVFGHLPGPELGLAVGAIAASALFAARRRSA